MSSTLLAAALAYARLGLRVLPLHNVEDGRCSCNRPECAPGGKFEKSIAKHPRIGSWQKEATTNEARVRKWWARWPRANIGIATGAGSGIVVLDVDVHRDKLGFVSLALLESVVELGALPPTGTVVTGSGGQHRWFRAPVDSIRDSAGWRGREGIDWRGEGGQVVAPPSVTLAGAYSWQGEGVCVAELSARWLGAHKEYEAARGVKAAQIATRSEETPTTEEEAAEDASVLQCAKQAKNAAKFEKLWAGEWESLKYKSQSEAELALCTMIAFWTSDPDRVDSLFRRSGLMRDKWDEARGTSTYGQNTISAALVFEEEHRAKRLASDEEFRRVVFESIPKRGAEKKSGEKSASNGADEGVAEMLVRLAEAEGLLVDDRGEAYAHVRCDDHRELHHVRSSRFRTWLSGRLYDDVGKVPGSEVLGSALNVVEARARRATPNGVELANRVTRSADGAIWIDLADARWRAVRVSEDGWEVRDDVPPLFRRFQHQRALPDPVRGGDLREIFQMLNVAEEDQVLFLGSTVAALVPGIPQAVLILHGGQGAAKTTTARVRRALVDPSIMETVINKSNIQEFVQALDHHYMPHFDNLRTLPEWKSEILCQAATGAGFSKRKLWSDADDVILTFRRPIVLTGISIPSAEPDLLDRAVLTRLLRIDDDKRKDEVAFWQDFELVRPRLFGGLLDALSMAMRLRPKLAFTRVPRLADFTKWGAAAAEALGYGADAFVAAMFRNVKEQHAEIVDDDSVARALIGFAKAKKTWAGTVAALYDDLNKERGYKVPEKDWPRRSADLGRRLTLLQPTLASIGVVMEYLPTNGRIWTIKEKEVA